MHCPHCDGRLPARLTAAAPGRFKLLGHNGEMDMDEVQLMTMVANAKAYLEQRKRMTRAMEALELYSEVAQRMAFDPDFARHVLSYDGQDGWRWFPGAVKAAGIAEIKGRIARGQVREDDLLRYLELAWQG